MKTHASTPFLSTRTLLKVLGMILLAGVSFVSAFSARNLLRDRTGTDAIPAPALPIPEPGIAAVESPDPVAETSGAPVDVESLSKEERNKAWSERVLKQAEADLRKSFDLFASMPVTNFDVPKETLLGSLFDLYGPEAVRAAMDADVPIELCCNALRKSNVAEAVPCVQAIKERLSRDARAPTRGELRSLMRFLGKGGVTDGPAAWREASAFVDLAGFDAATAKALGLNANPYLTKEILSSLSRSWDIARVRQGALEAMARKQGYSAEHGEEIAGLLGGEPGVSQAKRFASATAVRIGLTGKEKESLAWAAGLDDPVRRDAAVSAAIGYLSTMSSLRALRLVAADPDLRSDSALIKAAAGAVAEGFDERDTRDLNALRSLAAGDPAVSEILVENGLERILQRGAEE